MQSRCQLTQKDADRLMRVHEAEMEEYERMRKAEKKRMNAALEEKLEQRRLVNLSSCLTKDVPINWSQIPKYAAFDLQSAEH